MSQKYYYTCPIQALYMHIEFGVKFDAEVKLSVDLSNDNYLKNMTPDITKIYVKPESEHIFEPKAGDLGIYNGDLWRFITSRWCYWSDFEDITEDYDFITNIVERDAKHFFTPIKEEN